MSGRAATQAHTLPPVWTGSVQLEFESNETNCTPSVEGEPASKGKHGPVDDIGFLFDRYSRLVLGIAYRVLGNPSEAEEVVQETFCYICRKSQVFNESKGNPKAWIVQIAFSRALDRKLYLARRGFYTGAHVTHLQVREEADLERQIDAKLARTYLEKAFSGLTDRQRRTIQFFYFEGLDLREISEQTGEPLGSVRHHLYRGLERLRKSALLHHLRL
jgi:RNA polymerase sigma-70 factor (ECF subfamily)